MATNTIVHENIPITQEGTVGFIIGKGGSTIQLIGQRTGASLSLRQAKPDAGRPHPWVWIKGTPEQVSAAKDWVHTIIDEADTRAGRPVSSKTGTQGYTRNVYQVPPPAPAQAQMPVDPRMFPYGMPFNMMAPGFPMPPQPHLAFPGMQVGLHHPPAPHSGPTITTSTGQQVPYTMGPGEHMHFAAGPPVPTHQLVHSDKLPRPYTNQDGSAPRKPARKLKFPVNKGETQEDVRRQDNYLSDMTGTLNYEQSEAHQDFAEQVVDELRASGSTDVAINDELASPTYTPSSPNYTPSSPAFTPPL